MGTSKADYRYILKELPHGDGAVWALECYPESQQLPFVSNTGAMYIELKPGVRESEANELREILNSRAACIKVVNP